MADHSPTEYLKHRNTVENVWRPAVERRTDARAFGAARVPRESAAVLKQRGRTGQRALLVGVNSYPQEQDRLEGCVNDVFLMSSALQECGFAPENIRVCLDERATRQGITERLQWLLGDPKTGDDRVFYYSGHGASIPEYGENLEPDRKAETLVPVDFDWSPEKAITDDEIHALYSQFPYGVRFAMILDCGHSGGMHRQGGPGPRTRSTRRYPASRIEVGQERGHVGVAGLQTPQQGVLVRRQGEGGFFGGQGTSTRFGRASLLRMQPEAEYRRRKRRAGPAKIGPYPPLIIEACKEDQFSYEYRHGVTSYGAFTYALCLELRKRKRVSFKRLVEVTATKLAELGYEQDPQILGPASVVGARVPWSD